MKIDVEISPTPDGKKFSITGVDPDVWNSFTERARELRSDLDNPALAWAALLGDFIDSIANVEKKVIILRDIPSTDFEKFATRIAQANTDVSSFISELIMSASVDKFYLGRYGIKKDGKVVRGRHCLLMTGLTDNAMLPFGRMATMTKMPIAAQFAQMFGQIEQGKVDMRIWQEDENGVRHPFDKGSFEEAAKKSETSDASE